MCHFAPSSLQPPLDVYEQRPISRTGVSLPLADPAVKAETTLTLVLPASALEASALTVPSGFVVPTAPLAEE